MWGMGIHRHHDDDHDDYDDDDDHTEPASHEKWECESEHFIYLDIH